jgi:hypothetical protein
MLLLLVTVAADWPRGATQSPASGPNQRIQELQNRHDRRFRSNWSQPSSSRNRWR